MTGYIPLFGEIVTSSIWNEDAYTCKVWVTLMALSDMKGNVYASVAGLAPVARVTIQQAETAIGILAAPDPYSRSREEEGRRITAIDGGWHIVNHNKYRQKAKNRAEYYQEWRKERKEEERTKEEEVNTNSNSHSNSATTRNNAQQCATVK